MKRVFDGISAFDPEAEANLEKCKGKSMCVPHQGVDVCAIMERANNGLPLSPIPPAYELGEDETFDSLAYEYYDFSDEFEMMQKKLADLQAYAADLKAKQTKSDESAASDQSAEKSPENG